MLRATRAQDVWMSTQKANESSSLAAWKAAAVVKPHMLDAQAAAARLPAAAAAAGCGSLHC
jgi:hypothetical protein